MTQTARRNDYDGHAYGQALDGLGDAINETRDKLLVLQAAYEALGGTYEDEEKPAPRKGQKLLPAPNKSEPGKPGPGGDYMVTLFGKTVAVTWRQQQAVNLLQKAGTGTVSLDELAALFGGVKQYWYAEKEPLNFRLKPAGCVIVNVPRKGYRLEVI